MVDEFNVDGSVAVENEVPSQSHPKFIRGEFPFEPLDVSNDDSIRRFLARLEQAVNAGQFGSARLAKNWHRYNNHMRLGDEALNAVHKGIAYMNGIRVSGGIGGADSKRKLQRAAEKFYAGLNEGMLLMQCNVFGLEYSSYADRDAVVAALVDKHMEVSIS